MDNTNTIQRAKTLSCEDINAISENLTPMDYEPQNMTREQFMISIGASFCQPTPYGGLKGLNKWIIIIILLSFLIFGLIGNILSATIMYRRARRGLSSYFYLALNVSVV